MALEASLAHTRCCHLTTLGRRTGQPRRIEIWFAAGGSGPDTVYLLAGGREAAGWVRNLRTDPRTTVAIDGQRFAGVARILDDAGAEAAVARRLVYEKYRHEDDLDEWRDTALPIAIDLADAAT